MHDPWFVHTPSGGAIAVWVQGAGSPLVLVHGSMCDHTAFEPLMEALRLDAWMFAMDRRGFGASDDGSDYTLDREFRDVAAVVDAVADRAGRAVTLFGHSWGASCALGAARLTEHLRGLVLYEPSLGLRYPPGAIDEIEALVAARDHESAIVRVLVEIAGMTDEEVEVLRASPSWSDRVATAPTITREARVEDSWRWRAGVFGDIDVPTVLIAGSESPGELAKVTRRTADAVPWSRVQVLQGHGHFAHRLAPASVAEVLRRALS